MEDNQESNLPKVEDFVNQVVSIFIEQQDQIISGILVTDGTNFGVQHVGFPANAVKEIRVIAAPVEVNLIRAVFVV
jgi:hypothetical protein